MVETSLNPPPIITSLVPVAAEWVVRASAKEPLFIQYHLLSPADLLSKILLHRAPHP